MKIHPSNTHISILENVDHLAEAETLLEKQGVDASDLYYLQAALRSIIRAIEIIQLRIKENSLLEFVSGVGHQQHEKEIVK